MQVRCGHIPSEANILRRTLDDGDCLSTSHIVVPTNEETTQLRGEQLSEVIDGLPRRVQEEVQIVGDSVNLLVLRLFRVEVKPNIGVNLRENITRILPTQLLMNVSTTERSEGVASKERGNQRSGDAICDL